MQHCILISLGSNIDREVHARHGLLSLQHAFSNMTCSRMFESEAVGFPGSHFYNCVVRAYTSLPVEEVVTTLKSIELKNGRTHSEKKFCSRTLDLDLLTYDNVVCTQPVVLPREEILYNAFVLQPLSELVPEEVHPLEKKTYLQLWQAFDNASQKLWPIDFTWSES